LLWTARWLLAAVTLGIVDRLQKIFEARCRVHGKVARKALPEDIEVPLSQQADRDDSPIHRVYNGCGRNRVPSVTPVCRRRHNPRPPRTLASRLSRIGAMLYADRGVGGAFREALSNQQADEAEWRRDQEKRCPRAQRQGRNPASPRKRRLPDLRRPPRRRAHRLHPLGNPSLLEGEGDSRAARAG